MSNEAFLQYAAALKAGQRYSKAAFSRVESPYPAVLDDLTRDVSLSGQVDLGLVDVPAELIVGTKSAGRTSALAGNFMPLLGEGTEFAIKWTALCDAHLSEGIRDPIKCFEYFGRFYVQEGNKRVSVLKSYGAPTIPALVTRVLPMYTDDPKTQLYYEFTAFYALSRLYGVEFRRSGDYARLQAALGFEPEHVWTEDERRRFSSGFFFFKSAFARCSARAPEVTPAEALLGWLALYPFSSLRDLSAAQLYQQLDKLWPDISVREEPSPIAVSTEPKEKGESVLTKLRRAALADHLSIAFLYAYDPETSAWTRAHDEGRKYLEAQLGDHVSIQIEHAYNHDYLGAIERAAEGGAKLIFATTPAMVADCRKAAALHPELKILNCSLSQPYTGLRMYYSRLYEYKFIAGAVAGVMARGKPIGYVANYPIFGTPADINAFALGARSTDPEARVLLRWTCTAGDPVEELMESGVRVLSNRDVIRPERTRSALELGTYMLDEDGTPSPLVLPRWNWGKLYEQIIRSVFSGAWADIARTKAIHYWWGMDSGVIDTDFGDALPPGVRQLGGILRGGFIAGAIDPFLTEMRDQAGQLRSDGSVPLMPEQIMQMDWLAENVDGEIPPFDKLLPMSRDTVRLLGVYREQLPPEKEAPQL